MPGGASLSDPSDTIPNVATTTDTAQLAERITTLANALAAIDNETKTRPLYVELARQVENLRHDLEALVRELIHQARAQDGATWEDIARHFDLNHRQAAQRKWGR